eukprot:11837340-Prorocentrum_lima.AAC.1
MEVILGWKIYQGNLIYDGRFIKAQVHRAALKPHLGQARTDSISSREHYFHGSELPSPEE